MAISLSEVLKQAQPITQKAAVFLQVYEGLFVLILGLLLLAAIVVFFKKKSDEDLFLMLDFEKVAHLERHKTKGKTTIEIGKDREYFLQKPQFLIDDGIFGTKPLHFFMTGKACPLTIDKNSVIVAQTTAENFKKFRNDEDIRQLKTIHGDAKDLMLGIAIGCAVCFLIFFVMVSFKKITFN